MLKRKIIAGVTAIEMLLSGGMPTYIWTGIIPVTAQAENMDSEEEDLQPAMDKEPADHESTTEEATEPPTESFSETQITESDTCGEDLTWTLEDNTLIISGTGKMEDYASAEDAPWYKDSASIRRILIQDGVTSIAGCAFRSCTSLQYISLPDSLTCIATGAFGNCDQVTCIVITNPECEIGDGEETIASGTMIYGADGSTAETYAKNYDRSFVVLAAYGQATESIDWVLDNAGTLRISGTGVLDQWIDDPRKTDPSDDCYNDTSHIRNVIFEEGITSISCSLYECHLDRVILPKSLRYFGGISECYIGEITIPEGVTEIGKYAFSCCTGPGLEDITVPASVTNIGDGAFHIYGLHSITILNPDCEIFDRGSAIVDLYSFDGDSQTTIYGYIGSTAEAYAKKNNMPFVGWITYGSISEDLNWLMDGAGTLTISGTGAMPDFTDSAASPWNDISASVQRVVAEEGVTRIGENAFVNCDKLADILILNTECDFFNGSIAPSEEIVIYGYDGSINAMRYAKKHNMKFCGLNGFGSCGTKTAWLLDDEGTLIISGTGDMGVLPIDDIDGTGADNFYYDEETGEYVSYSTANAFHTVIIREGVTSIGINAFQGQGSLTSITIANSVKRIETAALSGCSGLHEIQLPDGLEEIGDSAFASCSGLTAITIPDSVTSIGASAFSGCSGLTSFTVPENVTSIGESAFQNCSKLTDITIPDGVNSIGDALFQGCSMLTTVVLPKDLESIGKSMFRSSGLASIIIPESVSGIEAAAFENCSNLKSITIPKQVIEIRQNAFANCTGLTSLKIQDGVTVIAEGAFRNCSGLTSVLAPVSVKSIEKDAFRGCAQVTDIVILNPDCKIIYFPPKATIYGFLDSTAELYAIKNKLNFVELDDWGSCGEDLIWIYSKGKLTIVGNGSMSLTEEIPWKAYTDAIHSVTIRQGATNIAASAFSGCVGLTKVTLPDGLTSIGGSAFSGCTGLTEVTLPDGLTSIGESAFSGCAGLAKVTLPDGLTSIRGSAFSGCAGLTEVTLPDGLTSIGGSAFSGCTGLTEVTLPDGLTSIGESAFSGCTGLTKVTLPDGLTSIGGSAFSGCAVLTEVTLPNGMTSIGDDAFRNCENMSSIFIQNPECKIADSADTISSSAEIYGYAGSTAEAYSKKYSRTFTAIDKFGTYGEHLIWILDTDGVLTISGTGDMPDYYYDDIGEWEPVWGRNVQKAIIREGVTSIGALAFATCNSLTEVIIPDSVRSIGDSAFYDTNLQSVHIPDSVTTIGTGAFNTGLASLTIPKRVTSVGYYAFCNSALKKLIVLNPECTFIEEDYEGFSDGYWDTLYEIGEERLIIYGYLGSTAEAFAKKNNLPFVGAVSLGTCGEDLIWMLDDEGMLTIRGTGTMAWTGDAPWQECAASIKAVMIEESVTNIAASAFTACTKMKDITIPNAMCEFDATENIFAAGITIHGYRNSTSEQYAKANDLHFISLDPIEEETTEEPTEETTEEPTEEPTEETIVINYCGDDLTWVLDNTGTLTISGTGDMTDFDSASELPWYDQRGTIRTLIVENGATSIGNYAFCNCESLKSVTLPDSVVRIGAKAFMNCAKLEPLSLPNSLTAIDEEAFNGCAVMNLIDFPDGMTSIGDYAFANCTDLVMIKVPDSVTSIGDGAFRNCSRMTYADLSDSLTSISANTFYGCSRLPNITIPESVTYIGENAFHDCCNMTSIVLPDSLTSIGARAFQNCNSLSAIAFPAHLNDIGQAAFRDCKGLAAVTLPEELTYIAANLFSCTGLTLITVPEAVTSIEMGAFYSCSSLSAIYILNPDCEIWNSGITIDKATIIHGYAGSTAEAYAMQYGRPFQAIKVALLYGDVDQDGIIDMTDLLMLNQYLAGELDLSPIQIICANVYRLGEDDASTTETEINALDAYYLQKYITEKQIELPYQGSGSEVIPDQTEPTTETSITTTTTETTFAASTTETASDTTSTSTTETTAATQPTTSTSTTTTTATTQSTASTSTTTTTATTQPTTSTSTTTASTTTQSTTSTSTTATTATTQSTTSTSTTTTTATTQPTTSTSTTTTTATTQPTTSTSTTTTTATTQPTTSTSTTTTTATTQPTTSTSTTTTTTTTQPTTSTSTTTTTATTQPTTSTSTTTTTATTQPTTSTSTSTTTATTQSTTSTSTTVTTETTAQTTIETTPTATEPPVTDDQQFKMGRDNWSFLNSRSSFTEGYYYLTDADRAKLFEGLSPIDSWVISQKLAKNTWEGSCYGMSCTAILASSEVLDPAFFDEHANSLYSLTALPEVRSVINYYFLQQRTTNIQQMIQSYLVKSEKVKLQQIAKDLASGKPELITFYHPAGHAIVGYGLEHGTWIYEGKRYRMRVLVYDCKNASFDDAFCIYCNPDLGQWYIPAYDASSEDLNCRLALCTNDLQIIDYHSYFESEAQNNDLQTCSFATLDCGILSETPKIQQIITYSGDINDGTDNSIIPFFDLAGSPQTYNPKYSLTNRETGYHLEVSQPQVLHTYLDYGDNLLIAEASAGREINYDPSGSVEILGRGMQYTVGMIYNTTALKDDWHTLTISGSGTDRVKLKKVDQGYILTSDAPLRNIHVNAENEAASAELTFTAEEYQSVLLYEIDQYTIGAAIDKNNDGIYEMRIAMSDSATETLGDLNEDGIVNASDAAMILIAAAMVGAGKESSLTAKQETSADVNGDGVFNASDAAIVLIFAAAVGAGNAEAKITAFVKA